MRRSSHVAIAIPGQVARASARVKPVSRPVLVRYLLAVLAYGLISRLWQAEPVHGEVYMAAVAVAATSFVPLARWYARGSEGLPMFELVVLSYTLQFSVPVFAQVNRLIIMSQPVPMAWDTVFEVLLYVELGLLALMGGYSLAGRSRLARRMPRLDLPLAPDRRRLYLWLALFGGGLVTLLSALNWQPLQAPGLGAVIRLLGSQFNLAIVVLAYVVYQHERRSWLPTLALYAAVGYGFLTGLTTGMLENALLPLVMVLVVRWHATRRLPWLAIVAGLLLYFFLNPAKFEYRREVWYGSGQYGFEDRLRIWRVVLEEQIEDTFQAGAWEETATGGLARFDLVHKFAYVRQMTPAMVPYYYGETYAYFLYGWIPRFFWPDKPSASDANQRLDVDYLLRYEWQPATIGIGQLPEAFANFGVPGIVLVMAVQGAVFALLGSVLNRPGSEGGRAIYLVVMAYFLNGIGSSSAMLFGALLQYVVASGLLLRPFARSWTAEVQEIVSAGRPPRGGSHGEAAPGHIKKEAGST